MEISELQQSVDKWIKAYGVNYFNELTNTAVLMEEVGEVARIMARNYGQQSVKKGEKLSELGDELADVIFVLVCIANQTGVDLEKVISANLVKKTNRDSTRHLENSKIKKN